MHIRKNYRSLTSVERDRFVQTLHRVKERGVVDAFARMHADHFSHGIHGTSHFLPWHREVLLRFERELQVHDPLVTIPYWDWTVDRTRMDPLWAADFLGQFDSAWNLRRTLGGFALPTAAQVQTVLGRTTYDRFWVDLESLHGTPHNWVGGVMASIQSPGDPAFYLHHSYIDALWAQWHFAHLSAPFVASGTNAELHDPLMEWPDRTPADVLNHHDLGYAYDFEISGRVLVAGFATGGATVSYWESWGESELLNGWQEHNDDRVVGDFRQLGYDQLMLFNRTDAGDGRVLIADFNKPGPPAVVRYWENWGDSPLLNGWQDYNDDRLVGDFLQLGYDQVMFLNRTDAGDGRVLIADFKDGPPATARYWENWGDSPLLNGWQDNNDRRLVGDFLQLGYDQVMFFNRTDAGDGRVLIADFKRGAPPADVRYWENWGQSELLNGWQDHNDLCLVGDFLQLGYDQVMFFNRTDAGDGRVLIADFKRGAPPADVRYWENWGQSELLNGWVDAGDLRFVGDFAGLGYDQVLFINRQDAGDGRVLIADFKRGAPPAEVRYWENWGQSDLLNGWHDSEDIVLPGRFAGSAAQLLFMNIQEW